MGVAYTAIAVVGLHVSGADVSERVGSVPSCGHEIAPRHRFCPDCGKRVERAGPSVADCESWLAEKLPRALFAFQTGYSKTTRPTSWSGSRRATTTARA